MSFTIILPVRNEEAILPCTYPRLLQLGAREVVIIVDDRTTDNTESVIRNIHAKLYHDHKTKTEMKMSKIYRHRDNPNTIPPLNNMYHTGIRQAETRWVLLTQADVLLDLKMRPILHQLTKKPNSRIYSFGVSGHPHHTPWNGFITKFLRHFREGMSGVLLFDQKGWYDEYPFCVAGRPFDTHLHSLAKHIGGIYRFIPSNSYNLRGRLRFSWTFDPILWRLGVEKFRKGDPFTKIFAYSILRMMPWVVLGWIHAKEGKTNV